VLLEQVPGPWQRVEFEARRMNALATSTASRASRAVSASAAANSGRPAISDELKELMVTPHGGAWLSMRMTVQADGTADVSFNYEIDPK